MDKNTIHNNDDDRKIRELLSGTKLKAGDNLKFRIMQQIETEKALSRKTGKSSSLVGSTVSIFGIMYVLIVATGAGAYLYMGTEALNSALTYAPIVLIMLVCGLFWIISCFDDLRHSRNKQNPTN